MSGYDKPMRCPFCGAETHAMKVYNENLGLERIDFRCKSLDCSAVTVFDNTFCKALPDSAVYYYNSRAGLPRIACALIGAAVALVFALSLLVFVVTERAGIVSRETVSTQTTEQQAADDGRLAGDDIEAAGYACLYYAEG